MECLGKEPPLVLPYDVIDYRDEYDAGLTKNDAGPTTNDAGLSNDDARFIDIRPIGDYSVEHLLPPTSTPTVRSPGMINLMDHRVTPSRSGSSSLPFNTAVEPLGYVDKVSLRQEIIKRHRLRHFELRCSRLTVHRLTKTNTQLKRDLLLLKERNSALQRKVDSLGIGETESPY